MGDTLTVAEIPFEPHHLHFVADAPDDEWLAAVAKRGWLIVTRDQRIRYKANEQAAVVRAGLHMFVLTQGGLSATMTGDILVKAYPAIISKAASETPPAFFSLAKSGLVTRLKLGPA